jgi:hypothetical protein
MNKLDKSQGKPRPTKMSNKLLPTELDTTMSPLPLRVIIMLETTSGIDVPAAKSVRPATVSGMLMVKAIITIIQTIK